MARLVVLGGSGFLGQHVGRIAVAAGHEVFSLSRREGCDLTDLTALIVQLGELQPEALINCAAHVGSVHYVTRHAADVIHDNLQLLLNVYRGVSQSCPQAILINPIPNCSYPGEAEIQEESQWCHGPVHDSVLASGTPRRMIPALAASYAKQWGLKSVNWIIANAYGPGDAVDPDKVHALNGIIQRLVRAQQAGLTTFPIWGTGKAVREWCYIEDAARILVESIGGDEQIEPVNLAQNQGSSILEIAELAARLLEYNVEFSPTPTYPDGAATTLLDDRRFRTVRPDFVFTSLEEGVSRTIDYYRAQLDASKTTDDDEDCAASLVGEA